MMTPQEAKNFILATLTAQRTIAQEIAVFDVIIDLISQSITTGIPTWGSGLTFNANGSGAGAFSTFVDTNGALRFWNSKTNGNTNNSPPSDPLVSENTYWKEVSPSAGSAIKEWTAGVYGAGLIIVYYYTVGAGQSPSLYLLTEGSRPFNSTNIVTEAAAGKWAKFNNAAWGKIQGIVTDQADLVAYVASQIAGAVEGLKWKSTARVSTTGNITLSGTQTIDGIAVVNGNRVLVKSQTTGSQNGIYICRVGAWERSADANIASELENAIIMIEEGTTLENTVFRQVVSGVTLGTTALVWEIFGSTVPDASSTVKGIMKLFNTISGAGTDGAPSQFAVNAAVGGLAQDSVTISIYKESNFGTP